MAPAAVTSSMALIYVGRINRRGIPKEDEWGWATALFLFGRFRVRKLRFAI